MSTDAEPWAGKIEGEIDRGAFASRAEADNTTLAEALARYRYPVKSVARPRKPL